MTWWQIASVLCVLVVAVSGNTYVGQLPDGRYLYLADDGSYITSLGYFGSPTPAPPTTAAPTTDQPTTTTTAAPTTTTAAPTTTTAAPTTTTAAETTMAPPPPPTPAPTPPITDYDTFIDPYDVDDTFHVYCGNLTNQLMLIVFRGNAHRLFAPGWPGCDGVEVEPGHYSIAHTIPGDLCSPHKVADMEVYSLEVVVQKGAVRSFQDPVHLVTCSYELGGIGLSGVRNLDDNALVRLPKLVQANPATAKSPVTLTVRDVHNQDVTSAQIGTYIQLVAFMLPVDDELSFRMWNCRAFSNVSGVYAEHYFLVEGCGDDHIIGRAHGFRTKEMLNDTGEVIRTARSVFFRAFSLVRNPSLQFECNYIVMADNSTDGPSCRRSPAALSARAKRSLSYRTESKLSAVKDLLPHSLTGKIRIIPEWYPVDDVITHTVRTAEKVKPKPKPRPQPTNQRRPYLDENSNDDVTDTPSQGALGQPLVLALLVTCCLLVSCCQCPVFWCSSSTGEIDS